MSELRPRDRGSSKLGPVARHGRLRRSSPWATAATYLAVALSVVLVSGTSLAALAVWSVTSDLKPGVPLVGETQGPPPQIGAIEGGVNLLLAGSDSGGGNVAVFGKRGETLNDVTMLLHISQDHTNATVVSFPRDMFVNIPACPDPNGGTYPALSSEKLNVSLSRGGLACVVLTVSKLTGLSIPFAAKIEFQGVIAMANAVGGVPVCVATAIHDQMIHVDLSAGMHTLTGFDALQFLRTRYGVGDGSDLGRISNQQVFLSSLVRTIKSSDTLSNPLKVYALAKAAAQNMQLSTSLQNVNTIASIGLALKNIDLNKVVFVQYPSGYGSSGGQSGVLPLRDAAAKLFAAISADKPISLTGTTGIGSALAPATAAPAPAAPAPSSPGSPSAAATASADTVALPSAVDGQTAEQQTCSKGQRAG
ncbi:MAG: LCP family protein [Lacisediminihabitans sp.]